MIASAREGELVINVAKPRRHTAYYVGHFAYMPYSATQLQEVALTRNNRENTSPVTTSLADFIDSVCD